MGVGIVEASIELFPPSMLGAFSLETICNPSKGFTVSEVSARIGLASTYFPQGFLYSCYLFGEPMSTVRRIAREIKEGIKREQSEKNNNYN